MADDQVAATLAAALIQVAGQKEIDKAKMKPAEVAAEIYFQCVDALAAARKKRASPASAVPLNI